MEQHEQRIFHGAVAQSQDSVLSGWGQTNFLVAAAPAGG